LGTDFLIPEQSGKTVLSQDGNRSPRFPDPYRVRVRLFDFENLNTVSEAFQGQLLFREVTVSLPLKRLKKKPVKPGIDDAICADCLKPGDVACWLQGPLDMGQFFGEGM
jgi:hypothetical protein